MSNQRKRSARCVIHEKAIYIETHRWHLCNQLWVIQVGTKGANLPQWTITDSGWRHYSTDQDRALLWKNTWCSADEVIKTTSNFSISHSTRQHQAGSIYYQKYIQMSHKKIFTWPLFRCRLIGEQAKKKCKMCMHVFGRTLTFMNRPSTHSLGQNCSTASA